MSQFSERPLQGIRVVDFGQYIAGPAVAMMLADQGADVVHIDPPAGPRWNNPADAILNRGKQRVTLDLKTAEGLEIARRLIASADVLVENFRPGVMACLGLDYSACQAHNPGLVYLSLPGFSEQDSAMADTPAFEAIIAAAVGQFTDMGLNRILMGINPSFSPLPLASAYASVLGATSVSLALFARQKHGAGERIEVPISAALMEGLAYNSMYVEDLPDRYKSPRELEIERRKKQGEKLNMNYSDLQGFLDPFYRTYVCQDGRPFYAVCSSHTRHPIACLKVLGVWDEIAAAGIPTHSAYLDLKDWPEGAECTIVSYPLSRYWADLVSSKMAAAFATKTAAQWQQIFGEAGVPGCAHQLTQEWINSEHAMASGSILEVDDPRFGSMRQLGNICWLKGDEQVVEKTAAALPGADNSQLNALLERWQQQGVNPADESQVGPWLEGVRILDLTNVIAGPTIAGTLARFGAEVISIDPAVPALDPWNSTVFGMQANQGKRSALVNIGSQPGQMILERLLAEVDVVTINASDAQCQRLGLTEQRLKGINPELILCQFDAYGGPLRGPRSDHPGYDDLVQATTGIMSRFGGGMDTPEEHAHFGTIDVLGGYCAAQAIAVALVARGRGLGGSIARSSLVAAGQLIQCPFMYDYPERGPFDEPSGREVLGYGPLYRCYKARDGWLFLAVDKPRELAFASALKEQGVDAGLLFAEQEPLAAALEAMFSSQPLSYWQWLFKPLDIPCQGLGTMSQWREQQLMSEQTGIDLKGPSSVAFIRYPEHPCGHSVELIAPNAIRPQRSKVLLPTTMPKYGAHTREVLEEHGFSQQQIDLWLDDGTVATQWSERYLPH